MVEIVDFITNVLSLLTLLSGIFIIVYILSLLVNKKIYLKFIKDNHLSLSFIVALIATLGSLFFSEIAGFTPCKLCWIQRIFMYPLVIILGIAIWKKDFSVKKYVLPMAVIGALVACYHYFIQIGILKQNTPCDVVGYSSSCSEYFFTHFGYITIPMMSLTAFTLIVIFLSYNGFKRKNLSESKESS